MAKTITGDVIKLPSVRLSFAKIFKPESFQGQEPKFNATFLLDPTNAAHMAKIKEIKARRVTARSRRSRHDKPLQ